MIRARWIPPLARVAAAAVLGVLLIPASPSSAASGVETSDPYGGSAATRQGEGRFSDLSVSVSKTTNLINESVEVDWVWGGSDPGSNSTRTVSGYNYNYMQIFQCWGDGNEGPDGPPREQCQFGSFFAQGSDTAPVPHNASWPNTSSVFSRVVSPKRGGSDLVLANARDPLEYSAEGGYPAPPTFGVGGIVPLRAAPTELGRPSEEITDADTGRFFDRFLSNEIPVARTAANGTGTATFEVQTGFESRFLNCGQRLGTRDDGQVKSRNCWLVVVPRDDLEVDGAVMGASGRDRLGSSPLSLSNWSNRIAFPLEFLPLRQPCALGDVERTIVGQESLTQAFSSWQSPLCLNELPLFYASVTDDIARSTAAGATPLLSVVTDPLPDDVPVEGGNLVYAPIGASGVTISYFIERQYPSTAPVPLQPFNETPATEMNLTPSLVAKLLTQSYGLSVFVQNPPEYLADGRPASLLSDPEFKAINTIPGGLINPLTDVANIRNQQQTFAKLTVPLNGSDALRQVWQWILADEQARAFLDGEPDAYGMTVNPNYRGIEKYEDAFGPRSDVQRLDSSCKAVLVGSGFDGQTGEICNDVANPYVESFDQGAAFVTRGQPVGSEALVVSPAGLVREERSTPQPPGGRGLLTLSNTSSSARRGLQAASLLNGTGEYVEPSVASMTKALEGATETDIPGVRRVDPSADTAGAYPLTAYAYAMTNPALLQPAAREDYADFIEYAATDGQQQGIEPGDLPPGYAPLPADDTALAVANAAAIRSYRVPATPAASPSPATTDIESDPTSTSTTEDTPGTDTSSGATGTDVPLTNDTFPATDDGTTGGESFPSVADSPVPVDPGSAPAAATPPSPEPVVLSAGGPRTPSSDVALRLILPIVLGIGILAAAAGGAFLLFGKGGVLASPASPASPASATASVAPPPSPPPAAAPPTG